MAAGGKLAHHDFTVHEVFRTAQTYKTDFQGVFTSELQVRRYQDITGADGAGAR